MAKEKCLCEADEVLILPCSGGSNVGQLANEAAKQLTNQGVGGMYCLAGIRGHVSGFAEATREVKKVVVIEDARLIFQECGEDMCFVEKWNESMNKINGVYQTSITLLHEQATQCKYSIAIKENGTWLNSEPAFFNLRIDDQENLSNNSTPGFEFVFALCTIAAAIFLLEVKKDA